MNERSTEPVTFRTPRRGIEGFRAAWLELGGTVDRLDRYDGPFDEGVVPATAAIAQTGSVVVDSDRCPRTHSLLPDRCTFVIPADRVVDTMGDVLRHRHRWWPSGLPSQVVVVTGPSRSADIEMTLTVGVHGPGEVHAIIVG